MNCSTCTPHQGSGRFPDVLETIDRHPCYSFGAHKKYARLHLPVAPQCNISCNYCNRRFDCLHESRPGVTSEILTPGAAIQKFNRVRAKIEQLSVVGIAGPGEALANWENTKQTIELIKECAPEMAFCLSTNGLLLPDYAREIISLGIRHVTVTVNCLEPKTGAAIYKFINYQGHRYEGVDGVRLLIGNQLAGIDFLSQNGVLVKVNIVMIKDINDRQIPAIVKKVKRMGAFMANIMPLIPAQGSALANYPQTSMRELNQMRDLCQADLKQMRHCRQCRADAVGLLGYDRSSEFRTGREKAAVGSSGNQQVEKPVIGAESGHEGYKIAVASKYGKLVDQHFGHASEFDIYQGDGKAFQLVEKRQLEKYCSGMEECDTTEDKRESMVNALQDCHAVLSLRIGYHARERLRQKGILSVEYGDTVQNGLNYAVQKLVNREAG